LILKHDLQPSNDDLLRSRIQSIGKRTATFQAAGVVYPKVKLRSWQRFIFPPECHKYLRWKREKGTTQFSEGPAAAASVTVTTKKAKGKKSQDVNLSGMEDRE
jgi:hypothetical protein